jgi:hypothetical protein
MNNKALIIAMVVFALSACSDNEQPQSVVVSSEQAKKENQQISKTALYLPGGSGLDFGKEPISIVKSQPEGKNLITYSYEFDGVTYEELNASIASILLKDGYVRNEGDHPNLIKYTTYKKGANPVVSIAYIDNIREGFTRNLLIKIWWFE